MTISIKKYYLLLKKNVYNFIQVIQQSNLLINYK